MPDSFSNVDMQHSATHQLQIEFTGSGSEYFRIWIVNLLLMFVTFGIYYPWAKVWRLCYFHANSLEGKVAFGPLLLYCPEAR